MDEPRLQLQSCQLSKILIRIYVHVKCRGFSIHEGRKMRVMHIYESTACDLLRALKYVVTSFRVHI